MKLRSLGSVVLALVVLPAAAGAQPAFDKSFAPATIGLGSTTELRFDIVNAAGSPITGLSFTDILPAGVAIATPASASSDCLSATGTLSAPDGGTTITLSNGAVGASSSCSVTVLVTAATVGAHQNVSGALTSTAGNSGTASATLTVDAGRPGLRKSFLPASIPPGGTSVLTFTIDNGANPAAAAFLSFSDFLPSDLVVATPANATTDCLPATVSATPGSGLIQLLFGSVAATSTCTVEVAVTAQTAGLLVNTTSELQSLVGGQFLDGGFATAALEAPIQFLNKTFTDDPVPPGGTVTLEFLIQNPSRTESATAIAFGDNLGAALSGLAATGLPASAVCGPGSQLSGTGVISLTGGNLPPEGSCSFDVTLQVPSGAAPGTYTNTTTALLATIGGDPMVGNTATDDLMVSTAPLLTKSFLDDPVAGGGSVTLRFTILNTSSVSSATAIAFSDPLPSVLPSATVVPATGFCGAGSTASFTPASFDPPTITVAGASLAPGASCFFDFELDVDATAAPGDYVNTTSSVTAQVGGAVEGKPATDVLTIVGAPTLDKSFLDDPVVPGGTVNLQFTLTHSPNASDPATAIAFSDDLNAALAGLAATTPLPISGVCGAGSQLAGTASNLGFSGGVLSPGASCSFTVTLQVPAAATAGTHQNTTSAVSAQVSGLAVSENPAVDLLEVAGLVLGKQFTDDPAYPGGEVNLRFTLDNLSPVSSASNIAFTDDLGAALAGLVATSLPSPGTICNGGSISGTGLLVFSDGSLGPGASCFFDTTLEVPAAAEAGQYTNSTSQVSADFGGNSVTVGGAADDLIIFLQLSFAKSFLDDPVAPGDPVTLEFTLDNADPVESATGLAFTDDLDAALSGLVASALPAAGTACNGGTVTGASLLDFSGGTLGPADSCSFSVTLDVPAGVESGTSFTNTTSPLDGVVGGVATSGDPATDDLLVAVCLAPDGENLTVDDETILDEQSFEVCDTIIVGSNVMVSGPNGNLNLRAGVAVIFLNDVSVGFDGSLAVGLKP